LTAEVEGRTLVSSRTKRRREEMQRHKRLAGVVVLAVAALASLAPAVLAGPDATATVRFGNDDVGSPFPPITDHDQSGNGKFNLIPRTVAIAVGGSVTYDIFVRFGFHEPKVYDVGTTPDDIVGGFPFLDVSDGLIASGPRVSAAQGTATWTTPAGTFDEPGRYLVLCNFTPHFAEFNMYGWVEVT
jgi:plastocyanin